MKNTADVTGGKPIAVLLQYISGVSAIPKSFSRLLWYPWRKDRGAFLLFCPGHHTRLLLLLLDTIIFIIINFLIWRGISECSPRRIRFTKKSALCRILQTWRVVRELQRRMWTFKKLYLKLYYTIINCNFKFILTKINIVSRVPGQNKRIAPLPFFHGCHKVRKWDGFQTLTSAFW
jgi:hypothetical protein